MKPPGDGVRSLQMNPASSTRPAAGFGERAVLGTVAVAALVFTGYYFGLRGGQPSTWNDTYEYAQAARNLATGRGLRSDASTVLEVGLFGAAPLPLPYFLHDAGNSVLMAAAFRLLGPTQSAIGLVAGACFVLLAPLTYVLGRRVFGAETAARGPARGRQHASSSSTRERGTAKPRSPSS